MAITNHFSKEHPSLTKEIKETPTEVNHFFCSWSNCYANSGYISTIYPKKDYVAVVYEGLINTNIVDVYSKIGHIKFNKGTYTYFNEDKEIEDTTELLITKLVEIVAQGELEYKYIHKAYEFQKTIEKFLKKMTKELGEKHPLTLEFKKTYSFFSIFYSKESKIPFPKICPKFLSKPKNLAYNEKHNPLPRFIEKLVYITLYNHGIDDRAFAFKFVSLFFEEYNYSTSEKSLREIKRKINNHNNQSKLFANSFIKSFKNIPSVQEVHNNAKKNGKWKL